MPAIISAIAGMARSYGRNDDQAQNMQRDRSSRIAQNLSHLVHQPQFGVGFKFGLIFHLSTMLCDWTTP